MLTAAVLLYVAAPGATWLVHALPMPGSESGIARLRALPPALLIGSADTAGIVEELLYCGYAIERLAVLLRRRWLAAALSQAAFALAHLPSWGLGAVVFTLVSGPVLTALYLLRRDLCANMLAHGLTALVQLLQVATADAGA